jgi:hypothetical protein
MHTVKETNLLAAKLDLLLKKIEERPQDKAPTQALQTLDACMTCKVCGSIGHTGNDCPEIHEDVMYMKNNNNRFRPQGGQGWNQLRPYYQGGNGNSSSFNPNQPSLRDLILGQAKINESLQKKLATSDKSLETIQAKIDGIFSAIKNQLSFNKMLETQLAQFAVVVPSAETGKISGQPEASLESIKAVTTRWDKTSHGASSTNYLERLTHPRKNLWGKLAVTIKEDPGTPMISCLIFDCHFEQALCDLGASVNIMPKVTSEKLCYPALSPSFMCVQLADSTV